MLVSIISTYPHRGLVFKKKGCYLLTPSICTVDLQYLEKNTVEPPHPHSSTERLLCSTEQNNSTPFLSNQGILKHSTMVIQNFIRARLFFNNFKAVIYVNENNTYLKQFPKYIYHY